MAKFKPVSKDTFISTTTNLVKWFRDLDKEGQDQFCHECYACGVECDCGYDNHCYGCGCEGP